MPTRGGHSLELRERGMSFAIKPRSSPLAVTGTVSRPPPEPNPRVPLFARSSFDTRPVPPRRVTRTEAIERARLLLEGPGVERKREDGSMVVQDPPYVNDPGEE